MKRYNPKEIEPKWQKVWEDRKIYQASEDPAKPKRYVLEYFPYPSGAAMHVGHVRNYTIGDVVARFYRMRGYNVMHPMGWDAFGLPAENYAIKNNISPQQAIAENTTRFKQQLMRMGFSYDWSREINSSDPSYYKWTQWFFKLLFDRGLAYQKESPQWWCETDKTVLANEQVESGKCWRCGNEVTKKSLKQWFFKITDYADRLVEDLEDLDWSDAIKSMQHNWVGRSKGAEITFAVETSKQKTAKEEKIIVFTTRADTLFGATFMVLAPEHPLVMKIAKDSQKSEVEKYVKQAQVKSDIERQDTDREKTGVFTGAYAINPANNEKIPIWIADYVLYGYGTGAIMAVPAHDERDFEFAVKFDLPIRQVFMESGDDPVNPPQEKFKMIKRKTVVVHLRDRSSGKYALLNWHGTLEGITTAIMGGIDEGETAENAALREISEEAGIHNAKIVKTARWISAATYCASHKQVNRKSISTAVLAEVDNLSKQTEVADYEKKTHTLIWVTGDAVEESLIPINQKQIWSYLQNETALTGEGEVINSGEYDGLLTSDMREKIVADLAKKKVGKEVVNYKMRDWLISRQRYWGAPIPIIHCPKDGAVAVPDDQLPVELPEVKSYQPTGEGASVLAGVEEWVNTTCPKCGEPAKRETDTMDGFACSSWYFLRFADPHNDVEPFSPQKAKFWLPVDDYIGGAEHAVMHLLYARMWTKVMYDAGLVEFKEPFTALRNQGMILAPDGQKMSKSKGNTIEPDELLDQGYGADSVRLMELFIGPWDQSAAWSVKGLGGTYRFLNRVWTICQEHMTEVTKLETEDQTQKVENQDISKELRRTVHQAIKRVSGDLHDMGFNTSIATLMELTNELYKLKRSYPVGSAEWHDALSILLQLLAPFAPHITEELWQQLGGQTSIHTSSWPLWDDALLVNNIMKIIVQINGKLRAEIHIDTGASEIQVLDTAKANERVASYLQDHKIKKSIYVPNRLVNFVV